MVVMEEARSTGYIFYLMWKHGADKLWNASQTQCRIYAWTGFLYRMTLWLNCLLLVFTVLDVLLYILIN